MAHYFRIPLNLPHAGTIAGRIARHLDSRLDATEASNQPAFVIGIKLLELLLPYQHLGDNPEPDEGERVRQEAAALGRLLVAQIEALDIRSDRLGQHVRNLFECLELGEEGANLSLRAGENPDSIQRP